MESSDFIALDFETANRYPSSACAIGIVRVEGGRIAGEWSSLIKPAPFFFGYYHMAVHGITPEMVAEAPDFEDVWERIDRYFKHTEAIVAHNAPFDMRVLKASLEYYRIASDLPPAICTCRLSRKKLPELPNPRLNTVSDYLDIPLNHHDALSDARAAALIMLKLKDN